MTPFLFLAIKSVYLSGGKTLKKIMWSDDNEIKPYFENAGKKSQILKHSPEDIGQLLRK